MDIIVTLFGVKNMCQMNNNVRSWGRTNVPAKYGITGETSFGTTDVEGRSQQDTMPPKITA